MKIVLLCVLTLCLAACGENRGRLGDAGATDSGLDMARPADAGTEDTAASDSAADSTRADSTVTDSEASDVVQEMCIFNWDCAETELCVSREGESYCETGERGTVPYDAPCATSEECASGGCIDDMFCTKMCENSEQCDGTNLTRCNAVFGNCVLP